MEPQLLSEGFDIHLGGPSEYIAWFDCGGDMPVRCAVYQEERGNKNLRWKGFASLLSPAYYTGQAEKMPSLVHLPKSDMNVRAVGVVGPGGRTDPEEELTACRADALLMAERAAAILGAVRFDDKKGKR